MNAILLLLATLAIAWLALAWLGRFTKAQQTRNTELLARAEAQSRQVDANLQQGEQQIQRWNAVLDRLEALIERAERRDGSGPA